MNEDFTLERMKHNGTHYHKNGIDLFTACRYGLFSKEDYMGFLKLNIVKYIMRYQYKDGIKDLDKAEDYILELKKMVKDNEQD